MLKEHLYYLTLIHCYQAETLCPFHLFSFVKMSLEVELKLWLHHSGSIARGIPMKLIKDIRLLLVELLAGITLPLPPPYINKCIILQVWGSTTY